MTSQRRRSSGGGRLGMLWHALLLVAAAPGTAPGWGPRGALGLAAALTCSGLDGSSRKQWKHDAGSHAASFPAGVVLNPALATKSQLDARLFDSDEDLARRQALPESFDARKAWRHCPSVSKIVDQGCCGSCWAYASALAMTDRQCILAHEHFEYSVEHLLQCSKAPSRGPGCAGGDPADAFDYWTSRGVVSGGGYNTSVGCVPYTVPPLGPACRTVGLPSSTPAARCVDECQPAFPHSFHADLHHGERFMLLPANRSAVIQAEILHGGPVVAIMDYFEDFKCYKEGVYEHINGTRLGAHAVRLIGWGSEAGVPYWLGANTWGTAWGEKGFFRIKRAVDECGIESIRVVTGYPSSYEAQHTSGT